MQPRSSSLRHKSTPWSTGMPRQVCKLKNTPSGVFFSFAYFMRRMLLADRELRQQGDRGVSA